MTLRDHFLRFAGARCADAATVDRWRAEVARRYSEPHRHYHTLAHIEHLLSLLPHASETVLAAVWFHDAIYDGPLNEERSAAFGREALTDLRFAPDEIEQVERMIAATKSHDASGLTTEQAAFLDADLAILGSDRDRYRAYVSEVRQEYAHVPEAMFRAGRAAILRAFLARERIYFTEEFRRRFERQARENMEWELARLSS